MEKLVSIIVPVYNVEKYLHIAIFTQVFVIMVVVNFWYNQAIRTEAQYLICCR